MMLSKFFVQCHKSSLPQVEVRPSHHSTWTRMAAALFFVVFSSVTVGPLSFAQSLGSSGTIKGVVTDLSKAAVKGATVEIQNPVTGYDRVATTDESGDFKFTDVPFNPYHLSVTVKGFQTAQQDVAVRTSVPIELKIELEIATVTTTVTVQAEAGDLIEQTPTAHTDVDRSLIQKLPIGNRSIGLSEVITNATPGVAADANGFFHPLGDHAQASISLDNQPINDQYSKLFSNQLSLDAIQSLEVISGVAPAEYGDKTSLVINAVTRTGVGHSKPTGSFSSTYGSFGSWDGDFTLGLGGNKWGNFLAANATGSSRYLDAPEFTPFHDKGNGENIFDRIDWLPTSADTIHLNLSASRSWFQVPNSYDQVAVGQDQKSQIRSLNLAPGWTHLFSPTTLLTFNPFFRLDHFQYYPSRNLFSDLPATLAQDRRLAVVGFRSDVSHAKGIHDAKAGVEFRHSILTEGFNLGVSDPTLNPVCLDPDGSPDTDPTPIDPNQCAGLGLRPNPNLTPGLIPFDLTRGGRIFNFHGHTDIKQEAVYAQDSAKLGNFTLSAGLRFDNYNGLSRGHQFQPRVGLAYKIKPTTTVLRLSYGRFYETPYNENLILSSAAGAGGLATNVFGAFAGTPLQPGKRNQFNAPASSSLSAALSSWTRSIFISIP